MNELLRSPSMTSGGPCAVIKPMPKSAIDTVAIPGKATFQRNIEAKFKLTDMGPARSRALDAGFQSHGTSFQRDTYFAVRNGKLKLREESAGARLFQYHGTEKGRYTILAVAEPDALREMLGSALGILGEIQKERTLLLRDNIRLHFDRVERLGEFGEIEIVLADDTEEASARATLREMLRLLQVQAQDVIGGSYYDLMYPT